MMVVVIMIVADMVV